MRCSQKEPHSQVAHFRLATARQDGDHVVAFFQAQLVPRGRPVRLQRDHTGQRVAHIGRGNAMFCEQSGLEREDTQHVVGSAADFLDPVGTPGPDGRADKMHGGNALGLECGLQPQVEVRRIHAHKHVGAFTQQAFTQLFTDAEKLAQAAEHFDAVAVYGEFVAGPVGLEAALHHLWAADACGLQVGPAGTQAVQHQTCKQVTGGFARHHGDAGCGHCRGGQRAIPLTELPRKLSISAISAAASGMSIARAWIAVRASSRVLPWR